MRILALITTLALFGCSTGRVPEGGTNFGRASTPEEAELRAARILNAFSSGAQDMMRIQANSDAARARIYENALERHRQDTRDRQMQWEMFQLRNSIESLDRRY